MAKEKEGQITRRSILKATGAGATGTVGVAAFTGPAAAHCPCEDDGYNCVELGKADETPSEGDIYSFTYNGVTLKFEVIDVTKENGEVTCINLYHTTENARLCRFDIAGGGDVKTYECGDGNFDWPYVYDLCAPPHSNPNRKRYEISHVTFYVCVDDEGNIV